MNIASHFYGLLITAWEVLALFLLPYLNTLSYAVLLI